jgi:hypothetical protein
VTLLRDTLPIVTELEAIRGDSEREGQNIDTFAKAAGWYRLLYGDLRFVPFHTAWVVVHNTDRAIDMHLISD